MSSIETRKILLFTDWYHPGYKAGGPIQSCKNLVQLLQGSYDFYILTSDRDLGDEEPYPDIDLNRWTLQGDKIYVWYASPGTLKQDSLRKIIKQLNPQVVYFNSMFSTVYTLRPLLAILQMKWRPKMVIAPRGMLHDGAMVRKTLKKKIFLRLFAGAGMARNLVFHATNSQEKKDIEKYFRKPKGIKIADNVPDVFPHPWKEREKEPRCLNMVSISRIHPKKNLLYAIQVAQSLSPQYQLQFDVYGSDDDKVYADKCRYVALNSPSNVRINFKGPLKRDSLFSTLENYHLFFLPTLGENFGHVIFESLSAGCPVLISDKTPWQDVGEANAGWVRKLEHPSAFLEVIETLAILDRSEFNILSRSAYDFARAYLLKQDLAKKYRTLFDE